MESFVLAVDQGTSATKALLVDPAGEVAAQASTPVGIRHPGPGRVEQDAVELLESVQAAIAACLAQVAPTSVAGIGLSTQRESVVLWESTTGKPAAPLVSWQDQRGAARAAELTGAGHAELVRHRTGLPLDPMFSALKMAALLDEYDPGQGRAGRGELRIGTVDAWLLSCLTGVFATEIGNASRTQLLDLRTGDWDPELLELFDIPRAALPEVVASTGPFGTTGRLLSPLPAGVPVLAVLGDSHAALFAHAGWRRGVVKATYGTGSSVMTVAGAPGAAGGVCDTIAWSLGNRPTFAHEANIRSSGRTLTWLAELLDLSPDQVVSLAEDNEAGDVTLVPAFGGLGAPWWDSRAVPVLAGFDFGTGRGQLARAAFESIAHQVDDVLKAFTGLSRVVADGGLTRSAALMQLQADLSGVEVARTRHPQLSAAGAGALAGLALDWWSTADLEQRADRGLEAFTPSWDDKRRGIAAARWHQRLEAARGLGVPPQEGTR
ncbi:FGGY family carbohydrate kinase [Actinomadura sp. SCN-SB]|uniref:FGGY family carbohydrate kinase n=1 Tax=Actinomadura sp. SCN-SB TaxID=3373092 RepID=UPI00375296D3